MITAVDTNVLIDTLSGDPEFGKTSLEALSQASAGGSVVICEVVYAELAGQPWADDDLTRYVHSTGLRLLPSTEEVLRRAGAAWIEYARARPVGVVCPRCGALNQVTCSGCESTLGMRQHLLPDFMVGAHAAVHAGRLLTRDRGYYRRYFPELVLLDPSG